MKDDPTPAEDLVRELEDFYKNCQLSRTEKGKLWALLLDQADEAAQADRGFFLAWLWQLREHFRRGPSLFGRRSAKAGSAVGQVYTALSAQARFLWSCLRLDPVKVAVTRRYIYTIEERTFLKQFDQEFWSVVHVIVPLEMAALALLFLGKELVESVEVAAYQGLEVLFWVPIDLRYALKTASLASDFSLMIYIISIVLIIPTILRLPRVLSLLRRAIPDEAR